MSVVGVCLAALSGVEWTTDILNTPIRNLERMSRVGDVKQAEVTIAVLITIPTRRGGIRIAACWHGRIGKGTPKVCAVFDLEFMNTARTASRLQISDLNRCGGLCNIPKHETALSIRII